MRKCLFPSLSAALFGLMLMALSLQFIGALPVQANPATRYVATAGTDAGNDCTSPGNPCATIQHAVDVAGPGDEIHVAGGTYARTGTVAAIGKELAIIGGYAPDFSAHDPAMYRTVLDANWGGSVITIDHAGDVRLEFLTITHGESMQTCGLIEKCGGGIYVNDTAVHIRHCIITDNIGSRVVIAFGGGIYVKNFYSGLPAEIRENQIVSNTASTADTGWGGGMFVQAGGEENWAIIADNRLENNTASTAGWGQGGGAYVEQYAILRNNLFLNNTASKVGKREKPGQGGGLYLWEVDGATLEANRFLGNVASAAGEGYGGAIFGKASVSFTMANNLVADNHASTAGGGLYLSTWSPTYPIHGRLVNNTVANNAAGAGGEGIWVGSYVSLELTNNLIAGHTVGITNTIPASSTITADTNIVWDDADPIAGTNAIHSDPLLTTDYHLRPGSPAVDAGQPIPWLMTDLEGNPRPQGSGYDLGAFEGVQSNVFLPLALRNYP